MPLGGLQARGIVVVGPASFRTDVQQFVSFVSLNTLRQPVFTPTNFQPPHQVDFQFPNIALRPAIAQLPPSPELFSDRPTPQSRPIDFLAPNLVVNAFTLVPADSAWQPWPQTPQPKDFQFPNLVVRAVPPVTSPNTVRTPVFTFLYTPPRSLDFQFKNVVLAPAVTPPDLTKLFRPPLITRQAPKTPPVDFQFPNITIRIIPLDLTKLFRPPLITRKQAPTPPVDFQFLNVAIRPPTARPISIQPFDRSPLQVRQFDVQFPNLAVFLRPVVNQTFDPPPSLVRPSDFQFPNVAVLSAAQRQVFPIGARAEEVRPAPPIRQLDFQFANLVVTTRPIVNQTFDNVPPPIRQLDFQFPNVALQAFAQSLVHPVGTALDESVPALQLRPIDLVSRSPMPTPTVALPPAARIFERPLVVQQPQDFLAPNLLTLAVTYEPATPAWGPWPLPPRPPQDLLLPNVVLTAIPPVTSPNTVRTPVFTVQYTSPRPIDFQFANVALAPTPVFKPPFSPIFERPIATSLPIDGPIPNLLTTTLAVVAKPIVPPLFGDRPAPQVPPQDFIYNNLLLALSTPPGIPRRPNPYLFTDRPSPAAPSWDQAPPNNTILLPPPVIPTGLHQNPMFTTMGRLSQLGNLP